MACHLSAAECFSKYVAANERAFGLRESRDGWWSMPCPGRKHPRPLRLRAGDRVHLFYTDLGDCPESEVFAGLVKLGMPGECLKRPKGARPAKGGSEADRTFADAILGIALGEGTATERLIRIAMLAADDELASGPMVEVFAANLRVSPASIYRATAEVRRSRREPYGN